MTAKYPSSRLGRLWAGWRKEYVSGEVDVTPTGFEEKTVFETMFEDSQGPNSDNYILWEGAHCGAVLNRYPYVSGHVLVLPKRKVGDLVDLSREEYSELWEGVRLAVEAIHKAYCPDGINVGVNIGKAAGASIPDHVHVHCLPRWKGDTTFLTSVAEARMIPETLSSSWTNLHAHWPEQ
ncbi:MAG: HIT family hydrolase [Acidimicrobiaceae bacterium]|nr:HIT family hydrolase [Acidimicrobiaceae bacterium]|tara:strand:- start:1078 stop:1614 length:537 start_codon:yes stop_codon:yes gene_type:complete